MHRRSLVGALLALVLLAVLWPSPAQAAPAWKEAVADIEKIRDDTLAHLHDLSAEFSEFLADGPTAEEAAEEYAVALEDLGDVGGQAIDNIDAIMSEFPRRDAVQDAGVSAQESVHAAQTFSEGYVTFQFNQYLEQLEDPPPLPPPLTTPTTFVPPPTTTTTVPPATTTTVPPATTTTAPSTVTTTTAPPTAVPPATPSATTTTSTPATRTTTTTTMTVDGEEALPPGGGDQTDRGAGPRDQLPLALGGGDESFLAAGPGSESASPTSRLLEPTLSLSVSRVLEPLLPAQVTDLVVSPLFMLELLWRAISSSGQGLVAPISLLLFSLLSLLRDRRRPSEEPAASPG